MPLLHQSCVQTKVCFEMLKAGKMLVICNNITAKLTHKSRKILLSLLSVCPTTCTFIFPKSISTYVNENIALETH